MINHNWEKYTCPGKGEHNKRIAPAGFLRLCTDRNKIAGIEIFFVQQ